MCPEPMPCFAMAMGDPALDGTRIVAAARSDLGRRFRPQGRGEEGLDCVGLAIRSMRGAGWSGDFPRLPLRGHGPEQVMAWLSAAGFAELAAARALPGDLLLAFPATRQAHVAIRTATGFVEASAGLRRVVERPWDEGCAWHSAWRVTARAGEGGA